MKATLSRSERQARKMVHAGPIYTEKPLPCIKVPYESETLAKTGRGQGRIMRAYKCNVCSKWHQTTFGGGRKRKIR